jgi:ABC-type lipoprotein release transport system permease subunit
MTWRTFAHGLGVVPSVVTPAAAVAAVVPATLALAVVISLVPAVMAARTRPALALRTE